MYKLVLGMILAVVASSANSAEWTPFGKKGLWIDEQSINLLRNPNRVNLVVKYVRNDGSFSTVNQTVVCGNQTFYLNNTTHYNQDGTVSSYDTSPKYGKSEEQDIPKNTIMDVIYIMYCPK